MQGNHNYIVLTDSACDLPQTMQKENGIEILNFSIAVGDTAYFERQDFSPQEFYEILREQDQIPTTSQITVDRFLNKFKECDDAGCIQLLYISINGSGSKTHSNAKVARNLFYDKHDSSKMEIHIVDSHSYSMGYGWYVAEASQMLERGMDITEVVRWLEEVFAKVEIVLAAYSLKHMKKSGRISAAAAITGELLGIRPIISLNDGVSTVHKRVRGDHHVHPALIEHVETRRGNGFYMVGGTNEKDIAELAKLCQNRWGVKPAASFFLGSAVAANTGPDAIAIVFMGKPRVRRPAVQEEA